MKESYRKGIANHPDLESCVVSREAAIEALTEAHVGRVSSVRLNLEQNQLVYVWHRVGFVVG